MGENTHGSGFPRNREEALTLLWLSQQNLRNMSIEDLHDLYWRTYGKICRDYDAKQADGYFNEA